jgi:hypothetical protein
MYKSTAAALTTAFIIVLVSGSADAQVPSAAECDGLRSRLVEHAKLSDGVRKMLAATPAAPAPVAPAVVPPATGRADAIRSRLTQISEQRPQLEEQRLGALMKMDWSRASIIQGQIQALDREKGTLETEMATLPSTPAVPETPAAALPTAAAVGPADRIACKDMPAAYDTALKTRRKELGARDDNAAVVPLMGLRGATADQIAQELAGQFAPWPEAAAQVGLLDRDGDGKLDAFVDVPARDTYRMYRQRPDGALIIEAFALPGRSGEYDELARRLDEAVARYAGWSVVDALAARPVGAARLLSETGEFGKASALVMAGRFADAGQIDGAAARTREFENFRGERLRLLEIVAPVAGGVSLRRVLVLPRANNQEQWEETPVVARVASYWRTDLELTGGRELRTAAGSPIGTRTPVAPGKVSLDR